jgi:excisionase family DNA binding protein
MIDRSTPVDALPEFLTPEEFRAFVGIGRSTMSDLLRRDELPHVRFGRCIRIPKAVLLNSGGCRLSRSRSELTVAVL